MTREAPKIHKTSDETSSYLKIVIYGPPGAGKTTMGATLPDPIILSAESGLLSLRDRELDYIEISRWEDLESAWEYLKKEDHGYKSVVIDSLTEVQKKLNDYIVRKYPTVRRAYDDLASESDWGANIDKMRRLCRGFRDLPMNVAFLTLSVDTVIDGEGVTRPAVNGKTLPDELCGWVDVVAYLPGPQVDDDGKTYYPAQVVPAKGRRAKIRVPAGVHVPAIIEPTFQAIEKIIQGKAPTVRRRAQAQEEVAE